jgi:cytochrome c556
MKASTLCVCTLLCIANPGLADEPEDVIKYRQSMMAAIGGHMGASTQIVRGKVQPEGHLAMHAKALAELSGDLGVLFPEGSDFGETKAKAEIWSKPQDFARVVADAKTATAEFATAAAGGDAAQIAAAHRKVGEACKACHQDFRQKDD